MLDSNALADLIAELVGEHVDRATAPLLGRIQELEQRDTVSPVAERVGQLERDLAAMPAARDGAAGVDGKDGRDGFDVSDIEVAQDGNTVEFAFTVGDTRSIFVVELPAGAPGKDGVDGQQGERGPEGPAGKLGTAQEWFDAVHYEGDVVTFHGSTYQAAKDTGRDPTSGDWICLAARGSDGRAARELRFVGTWSAEATYEALDVVALNGASFVAKQDDPGACPGEHWQLMAAQGKRGAPGERGVGVKGDRGEPGPAVASAEIDDQGLMTLVNADGTTVICDLYPVLTKAGR